MDAFFVVNIRNVRLDRGDNRNLGGELVEILTPLPPLQEAVSWKPPPKIIISKRKEGVKRIFPKTLNTLVKLCQ